MVTASQRHGEEQIWVALAPDALACQPSSIDILALSTTLKCWQWEVTSTPLVISYAPDVAVNPPLMHCSASS